jgi:hypothetical protein
LLPEFAAFLIDQKIRIGQDKVPAGYSAVEPGKPAYVGRNGVLFTTPPIVREKQFRFVTNACDF